MAHPLRKSRAGAKLQNPALEQVAREVASDKRCDGRDGSTSRVCTGPAKNACFAPACATRLALLFIDIDCGR
jgi:hypothetical protein